MGGLGAHGVSEKRLGLLQWYVRRRALKKPLRVAQYQRGRSDAMEARRSMPKSTRVCHSPLSHPIVSIVPLCYKVCPAKYSPREPCKPKTRHCTARCSRSLENIFAMSSEENHHTWFARDPVANFGGAGNDSPSRYYGLIVPLLDRAVTRARWRFPGATSRLPGTDISPGPDPIGNIAATKLREERPGLSPRAKS